MNTAGHSLMDDLNGLIDERLDDPSFSIESICQNLGVSRSHLYRMLKEETNLSKSRYLRNRRLLKTRYLLLHTTLRISEICDRVGFTSPQNLSTYFTEEFGMLPTEFRKMQHLDLAEAPAAAEAHPELIATKPESEPATPILPPPVPFWQRRPGLLIGLGVGLPGLVILAVYCPSGKPPRSHVKARL